MGSLVKQVFVLVGLLGASAAGCTAGVADALHGFSTDAGGGQGTSSGGGSGGGSSGGSGSGSSNGGCSACTPGDDATTGEDGGNPQTVDASQDDSPVSPPSSSGGGSSSGFMFPPFTLPDSGGSSGSSTGDGGANMCTTKICIDPVFDCPLQGCFNGCTNFHCM